MKIAFLCQRVPHPPDRGDRITTHHFLRHFAAAGHELRVGCFAEEARDLEAAAELRRREPRVLEVCAPLVHPGRRKAASLRGLARGRAISLTYFRHPTLATAVERWFAEDPPDLVYHYSAYMALYSLQHPAPLRIMQFAELDSDKWRQFAAKCRGPARWLYGREARLLLEFERRVAAAFDASLVVSEVERALFEEQIPGIQPAVVPNGVDVDHFRSHGDGERDPHGLIFTGVMDYEPNVDGVCWFVRECWPAVRARFPRARLCIVGARPNRAVLDLARHDGIEVTGRVPETPPYFDRAAVAIAPLWLARGVQNKVLEALSMGLPVVGSPQAVQGLGAVPEDVLHVADDRQTTVDRVCALLADPPAARAMGRRAADWVRAHYRWDHMYERMDAVIDAARARRRSGPEGALRSAPASG